MNARDKWILNSEMTKLLNHELTQYDPIFQVHASSLKWIWSSCNFRKIIWMCLIISSYQIYKEQQTTINVKFSNQRYDIQDMKYVQHKIQHVLVLSEVY